MMPEEQRLREENTRLRGVLEAARLHLSTMHAGNWPSVLAETLTRLAALSTSTAPAPCRDENCEDCGGKGMCTRHLDPGTIEACAREADKRLEHWKQICEPWVKGEYPVDLYQMGCRAEAATLRERIRSLVATPGTPPTCGTCGGRRKLLRETASVIPTSTDWRLCPDCATPGAKP